MQTCPPPRRHRVRPLRRSLWITAALTAALGASAISPPLVANPIRVRPADPTPPGKPRFDVAGAKPGEQLPNLPLYSLDGTRTSLNEALGGSPTLLLTSSFTCPRSRDTWPRADELARRLGRGVKVAVIYVVEAHPKGDPSPYTGVEDVTIENQRDRILCRQPATLDERLKLADRFRQRLNVSAPIFVDAMDNAAWKQLGGGPNMGVLVDPAGVVVARQGWFDAASMDKAVTAFLTAPETARREAAAREQGMFDWSFGRAAGAGDLEGVKKQLEAQPDLIRATDPYSPRGSMGGKTLLHYAAEAGQAQVAEFLLGKGADPDAFNPHTATPLHLAVSRPGPTCAATVQALLKGGARPDPKGRVGPSALQEAILHGNQPAIDLLLAAGAITSLYTDAGLGRLDDMRRRLDADPTLALRPDGAGRGPLAYAAGNGQVEAARLLISRGARDMPGDLGESLALHWAVEARNLPMADLLLDNGSNPDAGTWYAPFLCSVTEGPSPRAPAILKALLAHKANPRVENIRGYQALHLAAMREGPAAFEAIESLLAAGADVNARVGADRSPCGPGEDDGPHETALQMAAARGSLEVVKVLLAHGAGVNTRDARGRTALHSAAGATPGPDSVAVVKLLLDKGADVNAKDAEGPTPLDGAIDASGPLAKEDSAVTTLLRSHGARRGGEVPGPNGKPEPSGERHGRVGRTYGTGGFSPATQP